MLHTYYPLCQAQAPFDNKVFSKYFENTIVFEITIVLFTMSCLVAPNNYAFNTVVLGKLQFFLCIKKEPQTSFLKIELLSA